MPYLPQALRRRVAETAQYRCGYCQSQEAVLGMPLEIDHIMPEALGGGSEESNLWLACPRCNRFKGALDHAMDLETGEVVPLFHPRRQQWNDHFAWRQGGLYIEGLSPVGRATVHALQMNNAFIVRSRRGWIAAGWHPPH
ncbi:HNH endonuclease [bacterium]|nr:HNH endonuclease [bacterium]